MRSGEEENEEGQEVLGERPSGHPPQTVSASELRDLYRKVNGTLSQLRGIMERMGLYG